MELGRDLRVDARNRLGGALRLDRADARRIVDNLPVQIVEAHMVVVDDPNGTDASRSKIEDNRRAEASRADDQHARSFQLLLAFAADLLQRELALVALNFVRCEHSRNVGHL